MAKAFPGLGATVCDTVVDLPLSPTEGMIAYQKDTNQLKIYNGLRWVSMLDTDSPPGLVLMQPTSVSGTSVTTADGVVEWSGNSQVFVNGVFTQDFRNYKIICNHLGSQASVSNIRLRWRAAGVDYDNAYYSRMQYYHVGTWSNAANDNAVHAEWLYTANIDNFFSMDVFSPFVLGPTGYNADHQCWGTTNNLTGNTKSWQYATRSYDGFSLNPTAGTWGGSLRVYGVRDSI